MLGYLWGGGEGLAAALGDVGRWRGRTPGTECVQGRPERGTSVSGVVLVSLAGTLLVGSLVVHVPVCMDPCQEPRTLAQQALDYESLDSGF